MDERKWALACENRGEDGKKKKQNESPLPELNWHLTAFHAG